MLELLWLVATSKDFQQVVLTILYVMRNSVTGLPPVYSRVTVTCIELYLLLVVVTVAIRGAVETRVN